jgi:hypothetical protein
MKKRNDLLTEAIADAKAVRETALANARLALEEAFTPRLQSMLSAKLAEEEEMDDEEPVAEEEEMDDMEVTSEELDSSDIGDDIDLYEEDDMEEEEPVMEEDDMEDDLELEAIIRELEDGMEDEEPVSEEDEMEDEEPVTEEDEMEDDIPIEEIIRALREGDDEPEEEPVTEEEEEAAAEAEKELKEAYKVIRFLRSKINEVNLLNAKLLFSNKLFRNYPLTESQKVKVIENFDRALNLREVKLIYSTIAESLTTTKAKRQLKESYASKPTRSTRPSKKILKEGNDLAARWKKLANL